MNTGKFLKLKKNAEKFQGGRAQNCAYPARRRCRGWRRGVFLLRSVRVCLALTQFFYNKMYSCIVYIILKDTSVLKRTVASVGKDVA